MQRRKPQPRHVVILSALDQADQEALSKEIADQFVGVAFSIRFMSLGQQALNPDTDIVFTTDHSISEEDPRIGYPSNPPDG